MRPARNCASGRGHATYSLPRCCTDAHTIPQPGRKVASWSPATSVIEGSPFHTPSRKAVCTRVLLVRLFAALRGRFAFRQGGEDRHRLLADLAEPGCELIDRPPAVLAHLAHLGRLVPHS